MGSRIEDYAMIGDCRTAALISREGSVDWLCLPRFDSGSCFAALLGEPCHGRWSIRPVGEVRETTRRYRSGSLVLETDYVTDTGRAKVIDCMPQRDGSPSLVRIIAGERGQVKMRTELILRLDYGSIVPWVRRTEHGIRAIAGPDTIEIHSAVPLHGKDLTTEGEITVSHGDRVPMVLTWRRSHEHPKRPPNAEDAVKETDAWWRRWSGRCSYEGPWGAQVLRSLITLKALTDERTGGIVAAPTTSLPEKIGGERNWDYRYCWLRDATFTLFALMSSGYRDEASEWREWLLRAAAGEPNKLQIMYSVDGARRLTESEVDWLPGFCNSRPVRVGNAAHDQLQLDVYGELLDAMHQCYQAKLAPEEAAWDLQRALLGFLETGWDQPDDGIWEVRGPRRNFTHSKMMAWLAFDRAIKSAKLIRADAPIERWSKLRDKIHAQVCERGYDPDIGAFVQSYGSKKLDASLLMTPLIGFLPQDDPRVRGTIAAIEKHLTVDGFVRRYEPDPSVDGLKGAEGVFLPCTFWLCDDMVLCGRHDEARALYERLLSLTNDVGLISEEYDPGAGRMLGNFPQAFTHVAIVNSARNLWHEVGPAHKRGRS